MTEGTIAKWLKHPGDQVQKGDILLEIETDKATMELEAYEAGVVEKVLVDEGQTVPIGQPIMLIGNGSGASEESGGAASGAVSDAPTESATGEGGQGPAAPTAPEAPGGDAPPTPQPPGSPPQAGEGEQPATRTWFPLSIAMGRGSGGGASPHGRLTRGSPDASSTATSPSRRSPSTNPATQVACSGP